MFCTKCGSENVEGASFCVKCGAKMIVLGAENESAVEQSEIIPVTANEQGEAVPAPEEDSDKVIFSTNAKIIMAVATIAAFVVGWWVGSFIVGFLDEAFANNPRMSGPVWQSVGRSSITYFIVRLIAAGLIAEKGYKYAKSKYQKRGQQA